MAVQHCGSVEAAFDIALLNGISITDSIAPGTDLILPPVVDKDVVSYYANRGLVPATATDVVVSGGVFDETFDLTFDKI